MQRATKQKNHFNISQSQSQSVHSTLVIILLTTISFAFARRCSFNSTYKLQDDGTKCTLAHTKRTKLCKKLDHEITSKNVLSVPCCRFSMLFSFFFLLISCSFVCLYLYVFFKCTIILFWLFISFFSSQAHSMPFSISIARFSYFVRSH